MVTLNIALVSYCVSVIVLLEKKSEKRDVIALAVAEIMYRVLCVIAVTRNAFEAPQQPQNQNDHDAFENAPVPAIDGPNRREHDDLENVPLPVNTFFVTQPNYRMENFRPLTRNNFLQPFNQNAEAQQPQNQIDDDSFENAPVPAVDGPNPHEH